MITVDRLSHLMLAASLVVELSLNTERKKEVSCSYKSAGSISCSAFSSLFFSLSGLLSIPSLTPETNLTAPLGISGIRLFLPRDRSLSADNFCDK